VAITEDDRRIAKLATGLLVDKGRPDLSVSAEQIVRWRQVWDAIPVAGSRRGGRNQRVHYLPTAPAAAAGIALALDVDRNGDRAVLAAFGTREMFPTGAPVAEQGLRIAADHTLHAMQELGRRGYKQLRDEERLRSRSEIPRKLRVPLRHSREGGSALVSDAVLSILLGEEPEARKYGAALVLTEFAAEAAEQMPADDRRRIEFIVGRVSLAGLRRAARHVDIERWREACGWAAVTVAYSEDLAEVLDLTGADPALAGPVAPLARLAGVWRRWDGRSGRTAGYRNAILGLIAALLTWKPRRVRAARETIRAMEVGSVRLRAIARFARALPEHWRPAYAAGTGPLFIAELPAVEREELAAFTRGWLDDHPTDRKLIEAGRTSLAEPAREGET
jgi:hypothetical protein